MQALEEAEENLVIDPHSRSVIEGALQVESLKVRDVMVPRSKMIMISSEATTKNLLQVMVASSHSRFPIHNEEQDLILGVVLAKDLLAHLAQNQDDEFNYREYLRDALSVPESKPLGALLREFQQNKSHMAIVLDEYGEIAGLVTLEDVIEQIVGEIEDEHDAEDIDEEIIKKEDNLLIVDAAYRIDELEKDFNINLIVADEEEIETVGGLVFSKINRIPKSNEEFNIDDIINIKILRANERKILTVHITKIVN
jgi:magnesium and cobalt transporter